MLFLNTVLHSTEVNEVFQYKRQRSLPKGTSMLGVRGKSAIARHPQSSQAGADSSTGLLCPMSTACLMGTALMVKLAVIKL